VTADLAVATGTKGMVVDGEAVVSGAAAANAGRDQRVRAEIAMTVASTARSGRRAATTNGATQQRAHR